MSDPLHVGLTPGLAWYANGEPDPHSDKYHGDRDKLVKGLMDDDILTLIFGTHSDIVIQIAVKERIRWLARKQVRLIVANNLDMSVYDRARANLPQGTLTDDVLANNTYVYNNKKENVIGAKTRVKWLHNNIQNIIDDIKHNYTSKLSVMRDNGAIIQFPYVKAIEAINIMTHNHGFTLYDIVHMFNDISKELGISIIFNAMSIDHPYDMLAITKATPDTIEEFIGYAKHTGYNTLLSADALDSVVCAK